jgi:3-hydroxyisobutyrate dehydrogenase-like beta-hydroxyacid dehydrogenase
MSANPIRKVGFVGAGRMGQPMIGHAAAKGFDVSACDIDPGKRAAVEARKAHWQPNCAALAQSCEAILVCVGYDRELRELLAPGGGLGTLSTGSIVAVLSTVHPRTVMELSEALAARGVHLVDQSFGAAAAGGRGHAVVVRGW